jgi:hypothetical protein
VCQLAPSCAEVTVVTDERNGAGSMVVVVEVVAGAVVVELELTGGLAVVAALGVAPHPANATSPTDAAKIAVQRPRTFTSRSVGALLTVLECPNLRCRPKPAFGDSRHQWWVVLDCEWFDLGTG